MKKNKKIEMEYLLNCNAWDKFNLIISENALDNPVLTVLLLVNECIGYENPKSEKIAE